MPRFGHNRGMTTPEPSFHLRMPKKLKDDLQAARGRTSLNAEIVQRLSRSIEPDPVMQIADVLRPVISELNDEDQIELVKLIAAAADIMTKGGRKRRK